MWQRAMMSSGGGTSQVTNATNFSVSANGTWSTQIDLGKTYVITVIGASQQASRTNVFTIINGVLTHNYASGTTPDYVLNQSSLVGTTLTIKSTSSIAYYGALTELS